ncbi:ABC transporter ATP-binding protein [Bradyrhizobium canariense]|uniref:NitT/TauT family transport system ATP-binding protein n=1 Tax=Bradyrhizobium canariense TaxID=255045 RepID=A0A1H1XQS2_9BRAD|nr:ABC transporter ATP-binding protein [Bradyrhizobium canariense]SDT11146.1 NitT/TauT family transport system ATP-binding protein [Bradyrhizobium canariense]
MTEASTLSRPLLGTDEPKVSIERISKAFRHSDGEGFWALRDVDLVVRNGEFVCLAGPSGCGKSTILNILSGLDRTFSGKARIDDRNVLDVADGRTLCGYVFQEPRLLPWLSIEDNLAFVLRQNAPSRQVVNELVSHWLELVGLSRFRKSYPHQLSGGMQQRASIARAFAAGHDLLLMDEPFSALDEVTARNMRYELLSLWQKSRKTVIFVTHNLHEALFLADRVLLMASRPGRIHREIKVSLERPRKADDPELLAITRTLAEEFVSSSKNSSVE